jgi:hypothetical protein
MRKWILLPLLLVFLIPALAKAEDAKKEESDPNGAVLKIDIQYLGAVTASYVYTLWSANSNGIISERAGNNQNPQDDVYFLPQPNDQNTNRIIQVFSTLKNGDTAKLKATVTLKLFQGAKKLDELSETEVIEPGKSVINNIFIQLVT